MNWKTKLTSRKFWTAVASFVSMLAVALGVAEETGTQITALIMAGASVIAYIVGEGMADAAATAAEKHVVVIPENELIDIENIGSEAAKPPEEQ